MVVAASDPPLMRSDNTQTAVGRTLGIQGGGSCVAGLGGGVRAASGLFYQYLFTIETLLDLIQQAWSESTIVTIEGPDHNGSSDPDVVDFSVRHPPRRDCCCLPSEVSCRSVGFDS